ncbi:MurR/RpiR family transcriptional regulator [Cohaesibacter sp. CAU 1516]|uniref:MurR/RpiR family transcriptional regulator n=1 Tax=Cohaesibacter sp. CAU 1516 TaxID=2576038 RepID=UPI0010FE6FF6|nr:MurR/RpiR family transcriptional regulator [Cohaesibacter sp. CAU 1516]TLP43885.1 MurR/RpiR family transcriptional regulator [Cohaesibacter sp. CAU 1516]
MPHNRAMEPLVDIFQALTSVARSDDKTMAPLAQWVLEHQDVSRRLTISELAARTEVSETTIFRFCKLLGLTGYKDLRLALAEGRGLALGSQLASPQEEAHAHSYGAILQKVIEANIEQLMRTPTVLSLDALEQATNRLLKANQIQIVGFGSSAPIAIDACRRLLSLGLPAMVHSDPHILAVVTAQGKPGTVFLGISCSGRTRDLIDAFETAGERGLDRILITSDPGSPATEVADLVLVSAVRRMPPALDIIGTRVSQLAIIEAISVALSEQDPDAHAILEDTRQLEREIAKKRTGEQTK